MNIIYPKDEKVQYFIIDFRDYAKGVELEPNYAFLMQNLTPEEFKVQSKTLIQRNSVDAYTIKIPKSVFAETGLELTRQNLVEFVRHGIFKSEYFQNLREEMIAVYNSNINSNGSLDEISDEYSQDIFRILHLQRAVKNCESISLFEVEEGKESCVVAAPVWNYSVQLIKIEFPEVSRDIQELQFEEKIDTKEAEILYDGVAPIDAIMDGKIQVDFYDKSCQQNFDNYRAAKAEDVLEETIKASKGILTETNAAYLKEYRNISKLSEQPERNRCDDCGMEK